MNELIFKEIRASIPNDLFALYCAAFPDEERRSWNDTEDIKSFMHTHPQMQIKVLSDANCNTSAFAIYWQLTPKLRYVEHLATQPSLRGQGLGAQILEALRDNDKYDLILEVEHPTDDLSARRIAFYKRQGLILHDNINYIQPPYSTGKPAVPLLLMTTPEITDFALNKSLISILKQTVYEA